MTASRTGLEKNEIAVLQHSLPLRYDFRRLKNNGPLKLLPQRKAGQSRVVVYKLTSGKFNYTAYRISGKKLYDLSDTGSGAELDYPLPVTVRFSSPFSLARPNPISGKISPHNGIGYSVPMNTKIVSAINGKVTQAECNNTMNYLVEMSGKDNVKTYCLHLSKILVKKGTPVSRGTTIALFGNSRRSSDPHLYYGLVVNNSPVNSLALRVTGPTGNNKLEQHAYARTRDYRRYPD